MALLDKLRQELDRAGRSAQRALDEGRLRLDLFRARQSLDRFAQRFGYAVYRARKAGGDLPPEEYTAHMNDMTAADAEVTRLETLVNQAAQERKDIIQGTRGGGNTSAGSAGESTGSSTGSGAGPASA